MAASEDEIYRSLRFDRNGVDFSKWPKLSCSAANELTLATPPTQDDPNPGVARLAIAGELKLQIGVAVNELSSDEKLSNNSDLAIPTQKAVKTYVDAQIGQVNQSLSVKAALAGASSQDFQSKNLSVSGNLTTAGNVGIGTTAPTEKLEVAGKIKATELEASGTVKAATFRGDGSALTGKVSTTGDTITGSLTIQNALTVNGNVGIGTTTPEGALDVRASDSSDPSWITGVSIRARKDVGSVEFRATQDGFLFNTGDPAGANALYIRQDGNIGIGTTNPEANLHILGTLLGAAKDESGNALRICCGKTPEGRTNWQVYRDDGVFVEVDTSLCGFRATPLYFVNMHGNGYNWETTGGSSAYNRTTKSFRVYVKFSDYRKFTPEFANSQGWHIQWVAIGN